MIAPLVLVVCNLNVATYQIMIVITRGAVGNLAVMSCKWQELP